MKIENYGVLPNMVETKSKGIPARIIAVHKERYSIICEFGEIFAKLKTSIYYNDKIQEFPTVGDFVMIDFNSSGDSQIITTLPRKTFFSRRDPTPGRGEQAVAANFDYVFIIQSLNYDFNLKRLERYLTLAWQSGAVPVIILTKADLIESYHYKIQEIERIAPHVDIYAVSSITGFGIEQLSEYIKPQKTIVFLGSSGVGKSSLVNALANENIMAVNTIREDDSKGRHTTTHRQLIMLNSGAMIIDTPGMRELGMWDISSGIGEAFIDVEQYFGKCKFSDCNHQSEPGCAIKLAIESGELSQERWNNYNKLKNEAEYSDNKMTYIRQKQQWHKGIAKFKKQRADSFKNKNQY